MTSILPINPEESHASDIIGIQQYAAERPKKKNFLPWHKPRKQFVRKMQWYDQIIRMIEDVMPENNVLKYLGLPGDDLLDLRYFHQMICIPKNIKLKFLGFNHGANSKTNHSAELNISLDEVNKLGFVDPSSDIIGDNICQIANTESVAWDRSRKMGPYDVINIDLCDGFGKHPHDEFLETHYNTLSQLMTLQSRRVNPWLLFITTRTGEKHTNTEVFALLKSLYEKNLADCVPFLEASRTIYNVDDNVTLETHANTSKGTSDIFLVSLCKWIASMGVTQNPPAKIEVKSVLGYTVDETVDHQDLISIAVKIEPTFIAAQDRTGLAINQQIAPNECSIAIQIINRISKQKDVDQALVASSELMTEMIQDSSNLLEEARYDISGYVDWASKTGTDN